MNQAQWLWEYHALREKERNEADWQTNLLKMLRYTLIKILGLDVLSGDVGEVRDIDNIPYVPLAMLAGRREIVEMILKKMDETISTKRALDDTEFDKLSEAIAKGNLGDMEPLFDIPGIDEKPGWHSPAKLDELRAIGVKVTEGPPSRPNVPHIKFNSDKFNERAAAEAARREQAIAEVKAANKDLGIIGEPPKAKGA